MDRTEDRNLRSEAAAGDRLGVLPLQRFLYAALPGPFAWELCNLLNSVSGAIFGVMMTVVAADLTRRTGGFNIVLGALGMAVSVGASSSTLSTGISAAAFGATAAALRLAMVGLCGLLLLWAGMPESRPRGAPIPLIVYTAPCVTTRSKGGSDHGKRPGSLCEGTVR